MWVSSYDTVCRTYIVTFQQGSTQSYKPIYAQGCQQFGSKQGYYRHSRKLLTWKSGGGKLGVSSGLW